MCVVAGVLSNTCGEVLIAKRKPHQEQGGLWEFPGGKREAGEDSFSALSRELLEELGIRISKASPLLNHTHEYPARIVHIEFFRVDAWSGRTRSAEGQEIRWVKSNELRNYQFPAANNIVVDCLMNKKPTNHNIEGRMGRLS